MPFYDKALTNLPEYNTLLRSLENNRFPVAATGLSHIHKALLVNTLCRESGSTGIVVVSSEGEARRLCEDLNSMGSLALFYPLRDYDFYENQTSSHQYEQERMGVLSHICEGDFTQVVLCTDALMQYTVSPGRLNSLAFNISAGDTLSPSDAVTRLAGCGYSRAEQVEGAGQFALRGGILDVFSPDMQNPVRIEFWGDSVDSMAVFDVITQRRIESIEMMDISPAAEVIFEAGGLAEKLMALAESKKHRISDEIRTKLKNTAVHIENGGTPTGIDRFLPLMSELSTVFDYAPDSLVFVSEFNNVRETAQAFSQRMNEDIKLLFEQGDLCQGLDRFYMPWGELSGVFSEQKTIFMDTFSTSSNETGLKELVNFTAMQSSPWQGDTAQLYEDLNPLLKRGYSCVLLCGAQKGAQLIAADLESKGLPADFIKLPSSAPPGKIVVTAGSLSAGFEIPHTKSIVITHGYLQSAKKKEQKSKKANTFNSLDELHRGDYVVHNVHGIGVFDGIRKLNAGGVTKDYITILYAGSDTLYVPVTQLDLVSKYIGPTGDDVKIKLHKLGGSEWHKAKTRVRAAVRDMAKELIALYSARMNTKGFAFSPDTDLQSDFERRFEFEETGDQLKCINEIKDDMERGVPMERLLCGDVGVGKTEVALRAAFKCVSEGKQCALLVPTTILAWQHYQTIIRRMEGMGVSVELLSRFRTAAQQNETINRMRRGEADIVVGTHRLISKDITFKDLGLVIVDEEQRFGVAQKERLKELFKAVDVLTLSATPIPRTLNMVMSGIRDMSVIEEAPYDRQPVQTYVLEYNTGVIIEAINREMRRGGQVYYLHNRIDSIERTAASIKMRIPDARIAVAHGRMDEDELSEVWRRLIENEIDILVCTTIIETGVDVPNVNTIIIENADNMGLSQLHQLRGRVGRSPRRAYAYLTFRTGKAISEIATRRLDALREFTQFGSGLKIAMRDLEIRGAGNLLGGEQHGQMETVGYDMYLKLLEDAVREERGEPAKRQFECMVDLQIEAHIPERYITDLGQRLYIYRRIADIRSQEDILDVTDELIDRFGEPPKAVTGLMRISLLRSAAADQNIYEINQREGALLFYQKPLNMEAAGLLAVKMRGRVLVNAGNKPYVSVKIQKGQKPDDALEEVLRMMKSENTI